jgi:phosphonate transport system permease protein
MTAAVSILPSQQVAALNDAYRKAVARKRLRVTLGAAVFFAALIVASFGAEVNLRTFFTYFGNFVSYFDRIFTLESGGRVWADFGEWLWGWRKWSFYLGETILISYVGTLSGAVFAFGLNFLAAENTAPAPWLRFAVKRFMEFCRTVPDIVFALIFVIAFGLGPMAGVLAITIHCIGALGKQYAEIVENIDMKPVEGVRSTGASWVSCLRFAVLPQVAAGFASYTLLRFEINVRGASVMGFVGAGGIGQELVVAIRKFYYSDVSAILLMIVLTVFVIDIGTGWIRGRLFGKDRRMTKLPTPDLEGLRRRFPGVFRKPVSARLAMPALILGALGIFVFGIVHLGFSPARMLSGLRQLGWIVMLMLPPDPGSSLPLYLKALGETLSIALLGTTLAAVFALPVSLLAAKNIVPSSIFRFPVRRFLDSIRGVDTLIWALVWINVVGLGPFAGVLAIAVSDFGAFGKLFSEAIEGADQKQVEGVRASGGNALHEIRFGLMPQVLPVISGQVLYFIESNTRSATIIGIVGAGGIGLQLAEQIRVLEWQKVSFLILLILVAVAAIDWISGKLRFAIIGRRAVV